MGADSVIGFQPEYVPTADYCYGFAVTGRPDEIFVSLILPGRESLAERWQPEGKHESIYVFGCLDTGCKTAPPGGYGKH